MLSTTPAIPSLESWVDTAFGLAKKTLEGIDQLSTLNLQLVKTLLSESAEKAYAAVAARSPDELMALQTAAWQALPAKSTAYTRQAQAIVAAMVDAYRATAEAQAAEFEATLLGTMNDTLKALPGGEEAVALTKSAIASARSAYDGAAQAQKQVADAVAENLTEAA
jgi:phasin family protein